jgi:outer membrane scaffolding protein for murein synthesis (MipA/OmpV family)
MMRHLLSILLCTATPSILQAQELGWSYSVGIGAEREPGYVGSDTYTTELSYEAEARYTASERLQWIVSLGGLGVLFEPIDDTVVAMSLEYEPGREIANDPVLSDFAEMDDTWEVQAILYRDIGPLDVGFGLQQDLLGTGKGLVGFVGAEFDADLTDRLEFSTGLVASFANATHMNTEVGISSAESAASGLDTYEAPGGYKSLTLNLGVDYAVTDFATLYAEAAIERYGASISDSPLVAQEGTATTSELGVGLRFNF